MKKLSEQLKELAAEETANCLGETEPDSYWPGGKAEAYAHARRLVLSLESTNAELTKRVAELESVVADINPERNVLALLDAWQDEIMTLRAQIAALQSQLAWTPVSAGLPTEPGVYEFLKRKSNGLIEVFDMFELSPGHEFGDWGDVLSGEHFSSTEMPELEHTHFRRIELPEAVEYHAQGDAPKAVLDIVQEQYSKLPKGGES